MEKELYHHGVKGMRWGVRRYQNKDGSLTAAGKKRSSDPDRAARNKAIAKKVAIGAAATLTVAAAVGLYATNPAVQRVVNSMGKKTLGALKSGGGKAIARGKAFVKSVPSRTKQAGKTFVKNSMAGIREGVKEGVKEAPKKAVKAIITGVTLNAAKRGLDTAVGKAEAERIMKANNGKKIDSFWKVQNYDDDD